MRSEESCIKSLPPGDTKVANFIAGFEGSHTMNLYTIFCQTCPYSVLDKPTVSDILRGLYTNHSDLIMCSN